MLFSELYGTYYQVVSEILAVAAKNPVGKAEMFEIIKNRAFGESGIRIPESIGEEHWQLLKPDGTSILKNSPDFAKVPLTTLQKRWINAILLDPRIKLFTDDVTGFPDVEPLFLPEDIDVFDRYSDGDPFENPTYIRNFRLILDAIENKRTVEISTMNRRGNRITAKTVPENLEYSEKDDKFRLIGTGSKLGNTINLGRIVTCELCDCTDTSTPGKRNRMQPRTVIFELSDERNALERVLMHFAHFEKEAERVGEHKYRVTLHYYKEDETEILIRILSFGPMVRVVKPNSFINLIKNRLISQMNCEL